MHASSALATPSRSLADDTAIGDARLIVSQRVEPRNREEWQQVIDNTLIEWGRDPTYLEEHDLIPPSQMAIASAIRVAEFLKERGAAFPKRVVPDGDGGIVFRRWTGQTTESIEIDQIGTAEWIVCRDNVVVRRVAWTME